MRILKRLTGMTVFALCLLAFSAGAMAMDFSAEIVSSDDGGKTTRKEKVYMTEGKVRTEADEMATILRMDKKLVWILMLDEKTYMEQPFKESSATARSSQEPTAEPPEDEMERVFILTETVNGYVSDKYRVTYKKQESHYIWISSDPGLTMEVKSAALDGSWWQEYRNISLGTPAAALFEIPAGFTKMSMPGMSGMSGMAGMWGMG